MRLSDPETRNTEKAMKRSFPKTSALLIALAICTVLSSGAFAQSAEPFGNQENPLAEQHDASFENYRFRDGETLAKLRIHYATLGQPHRNEAGEVDNAVLVLHWTGSDSRVLLTQPFMESLFSPGRPLDAKRYFLIFADSVGHGRSSKPSDGLRMAFPKYGYGDIVDLQHRLVTETLKIKRLRAILGISMGGMNAWQWAEAYPGAVDGIMPVVSFPTKVSGRNLIWRRLAIGYIRNDPDWQDGNYQKPFRGWIQSYQLLRMMIDGVPHLQAIAPDGAAADRFIAETAKQSSVADANDLLYSLQASADYDPEVALGTIRTRVFALNFGDDEFNPDQLQILEHLITRVPHGTYKVQPGSEKSFGHLTMAHPELWAEHVATFMNQLGDGRSQFAP
jgi:homoserine O-acetyltransferase/O-succinyltransferase